MRDFSVEEQKKAADSLNEVNKTAPALAAANTTKEAAKNEDEVVIAAIERERTELTAKFEATRAELTSQHEAAMKKAREESNDII